MWWKPQQICLQCHISISCISIVVAAAEEVDKDGAPSVLTSRCSHPFKVSKCHREKDHFPPETLTVGRGQSDSTAALVEVSGNQPIRRGVAGLGGWRRSVCCHFMIWLLLSNLLSLLEQKARHYPLLTPCLTNNSYLIMILDYCLPCFFFFFNNVNGVLFKTLIWVNWLLPDTQKKSTWKSFQSTTIHHFYLLLSI